MKGSSTQDSGRTNVYEGVNGVNYRHFGIYLEFNFALENMKH
jgi:hypothetical protein